MSSGANVINKFECYAEIKHDDWMLQVIWLVLTNQSALFKCGTIMFD